MKRQILIIAVILTAAPAARANVRLPAVFSEHMVVQRDAEIPVWGWADFGEKVAVSLAGQSEETTAGPDGAWRVTLGKLPAGGPHTLKVKGNNTVEVEDVLVGEVWLASGQSNMAMSMERVRDFETERAAASLPQIRMFTTGRDPARDPEKDCKGEWEVCSPDTVGKFSATAFLFVRELHRELNVPVGVLNSSVGGTPIEAWTSIDALQRRPELKPVLEDWARKVEEWDPEKAKAAYEKLKEARAKRAEKAKADGKARLRPLKAPVNPRDDSHHPGNLFNGMIAPLAPYAIRGAIWYQGENNTRTETAALYDRLLAALTSDWRARWDQGDFPFAWVQLPNFNAPADRDWPGVREGMRRALAIPNTGMAITLDIGDPGNIHPANKQDVGKRLALWALASVYDKGVAWSGPLLRGHEIRGGEVRVAFDHAGGLQFRGEPSGFEVLDPGGQWHAAQAKIDGEALVLSSADVPKPAAARYAWANNPAAVLFNGAGLPASPFTTEEKIPVSASAGGAIPPAAVRRAK